MPLLQSPLLQNFSNLTHCFTTKQNGNLAFHVNDNIQNVLTNHKLLALKLQFKQTKLEARYIAILKQKSYKKLMLHYPIYKIFIH